MNIARAKPTRKPYSRLILSDCVIVRSVAVNKNNNFIKKLRNFVRCCYDRKLNRKILYLQGLRNIPYLLHELTQYEDLVCENQTILGTEPHRQTP